jgi:hypothetical protein
MNAIAGMMRREALLIFMLNRVPQIPGDWKVRRDIRSTAERGVV